MKRTLFLLMLCLAMALCLAACGGKTTSESGENSVSYSEAEVKDAVEIDVFEDVRLVYDGWNDLGTVAGIATDQCENFIQENVKFSFASDYQNLTNGDVVTVVAEYDENTFLDNGYEAANTIKEFSVEGLRQISVAQDYHDDVAWVYVMFAAEKKWCCCDKEGNILFSLNEGSTPTTYFANGVAIVDYNKVIDKSGNVVWSIEKDGAAAGNELWGEENVTSIRILFDYEEDYFGYTFVEFHIESFELTADMTGILDNQGNWYLEPVGYFAFHSYIGDGCYNFLGAGIYNLLANEIIVDNWDEEQQAIQWAWIRNYRLEEHGGLIYEWRYPEKPGFYNAEGTKVIDLSKYNLVTYVGEPEFNEGYALLEIENDQGSRYYTIIDSTGEEMFPPQKSVGHGELRYGYYWVEDVGYKNIKGELAFDIPLTQGSAFNNGMAVVNTENFHTHYMDTSGNIIF